MVMNRESWATFARDEGLPVDKPEDEQAKARILGVVGRELEAFSDHAQIRAVHLTFDAWTVANGLLPPTLKAERGPLQSKYATEIEASYGSPR